MTGDSRASALARGRFVRAQAKPPDLPTTATAQQWNPQLSRWEVVDEFGDRKHAVSSTNGAIRKGGVHCLKGDIIDDVPHRDVPRLSPSRPLISAPDKGMESAVLVKITMPGIEQYWIAYKNDRFLIKELLGLGMPLTWQLIPNQSRPPFPVVFLSGGTTTAMARDTYWPRDEGETIDWVATFSLAQETEVRISCTGSILCEPESFFFVGAMVYNHPGPISSSNRAIAVDGDEFGEFEILVDTGAYTFPALDPAPGTLGFYNSEAQGSAELYPLWRTLPAGDYQILLDGNSGGGRFLPVGPLGGQISIDLQLTIAIGGEVPDSTAHLSFGSKWHCGVVAEETGMTYRSQGEDEPITSAHPAAVTPSPDDWRGAGRMVYPPLPSPPPSCAGQYRDNDFANLHKAKVYEVDPTQQIDDGNGGTENLASAILSRPAKGTVQVRNFSDASGTCQVTPPLGKVVRLPKVLTGSLENVDPATAEVIAIAIKKSS